MLLAPTWNTVCSHTHHPSRMQEGELKGHWHCTSACCTAGASPSAAVHVRREQHREQTESFEPVVSPQPRAALKCRGAVCGYSCMAGVPPYTLASAILHRGRWPARDKHRSPLDVEQRSCSKESNNRPGSPRGLRSSCQHHCQTQETSDSTALPHFSSAEQRATQTGPTAVPGGPGPAPAATHTGQCVRGLRGGTSLCPLAPALFSTLTSCSQHHHPTGPTAFSPSIPVQGQGRQHSPTPGSPSLPCSEVTRAATLFRTLSKR